MATTFVDYTGDGNATKAFSFPSYKVEDIKVKVDDVVKTSGNHYNITSYTTTGGGNVVFTAGNIPASPADIHIYRDTDVDSAKHTYQAGSSVKAGDLNNNHTQLLYALQEEQNQPVRVGKIKDNAVTSSKILDGTIVEADLANSAVTSNKIADNAVTTTEILNGAVTRDKIAADAIDGTKLADNAVNSEHYVDLSIDSDHIADDAVTSTKIADGAVVTDRIAGSAVNSTRLADNAVSNSKIQASAVSTAKIQDAAIENAKIANDAVTIEKIADAVIVTNSEQASHSVDDNTFFTTSAAEARYFNASTGETIKDGQSFPDNDTTIATTAAINDRIIDLVDDVGGFVPIASETVFPNANPDVNNGTGTLISIKEIGSSRTPSGGTVTISNGNVANNATITITGCGSTVLAAGFGAIVETTSTLHTYTFHRLSPKATEVTTVASKATEVTTVHTNINNVNTVATNISDINAVAADATDIGAVAAKATEIGRLGTADAVADMAILGTADIVSDLNTLGTADVVADMNLLATSDVIADMNMLAVSDVISDMNDLATSGNITAMSNCSNSITNINTAATNLASINNFANLYRIGSNNPTGSLDVGDLFFNTTSNSLKIYTGSAWVDGVTQTGNFALKTGNTFTGSNIYNDNAKAIFGTGSDFSITHANDATLLDNTLGTLTIRNTSGSAIQLQPRSGEDGVKINQDAGIELYYDNSKKFETTSDGIDVDGTVTANDIITAGALLHEGDSDTLVHFSAANTIQLKTGGTSRLEVTNTGLALQNGYFASNGNRIIVGDSSGATDDRIVFGNNNDLQIYHDGTDNLLSTSGTVLAVHRATTNSGNPVFEVRSNHGATNQVKLQVDGDGDVLIPTDTGKLQIGTSQDLELYHDGADSYIRTHTTGNLINRARVSWLAQTNATDSGADHSIKALQNGAVELYYDNSKKFETVSNGAVVTGSLGVDQLYLGDNEQIKIGAEDDFLIYHGGSENVLDGVLHKIELRHGSEKHLVANPDGAVELYHDNAKKLQSVSSGIEVLGTEGINAEIFISADEGDDNNDKHKIVAFQNEGKLGFYNYTSGSWEQNLALVGNGAVELYYDNSKKIQTASDGVQWFGKLKVADGSSSSNQVTFGDNADLKIYHNGTNNYVESINGVIHLRSNYGMQFDTTGSGNTWLKCKTSNNQLNSTATSVELNYNNVKKFETTSTGVSVTGTVAATSYTGDGSNLSGINSDLVGDTSPQLGGDLDTNSHHILIDDEHEVKWGNDSDLRIFHANGNANFIQSYNNHNLRIAAFGTGRIKLQVNEGEDGVVCVPNGTTELFYDGTKKLETTNDGVDVDGSITCNDLVTAGAVLHEGDTNTLIHFDQNDNIAFKTNGTVRFRIDNSYAYSYNSLIPSSNNSFDLGTTSNRWRNVYTNDLHLSNEGHTNDVDGSWGNWTIQEGESDLFLKNNRSGKKYKFNLTEVA